MPRWSKALLLTTAALFLIVQCAVFVEKHYEKEGKYPPTWALLVNNAIQGNLGIGTFSSTPNGLDLQKLEPGDILLGGNPGGSYGHYTHAGIYIGNNQVVTMYTSTGVYLERPEAYHRYHWAAILRVKSNQKQKEGAIKYCSSQVGAPFFILSPKTEDGLWYCSKLIWVAYWKQGIDLDPFNSYWILPDAFFHSPDVEIIDEAKVA